MEKRSRWWNSADSGLDCETRKSPAIKILIIIIIIIIISIILGRSDMHLHLPIVGLD